MPIIDIFSSDVRYLYRVRLCSSSAFCVLIAFLFSVLTPLLFVHYAGGYWIRTRTYWEVPDVHFKHKYLLLIEQDNLDPLICSTFSHYKDNPIKDHCSIVKVKEVDRDVNGLQDYLKFEVELYTAKPIRSLILLLFFNYELKEHIRVAVEAMTIIEYTVSQNIQELYFIGDLMLRQNNVLYHDEMYLDDNSTDINDFTLVNLLTENANRLLSGKISNLKVLPSLGFIKDEPVKIKVEIVYASQPVKYQPGFWEEIKWGWMQYLSIFVIVIYFARKILTRLFTSKTLRSYTVTPWHLKTH
ncbi:transmembrane protein 231-like [Trichogramma pretiosum]|uniref:transmembrane protein 231-like n=1 Tax=Trichogramma pretiosum TaxID=7493 RepID=UPI0006C99C92|nr:transmembrane protein 231-like [Trichogramma pretiosum]